MRRRFVLVAILVAVAASPASAEPPVISGWPGNLKAEATSPEGAAVSWPALTATAGGKSVDVACVPKSGSVFPLGSTPVTCTASDGSGSTSSTGFTVTVADTTPPAFSGDDDAFLEATGSGGVSAGYKPPTARDLVDISVTPACSPSPTAGLPFGPTTARCTVKDSRGNSASTTFTLTVRDTTPPEFESVPDDVKVETNGPAVTVDYDDPTAVDTVDGDVFPSCTPASGKKFPLGTTSVSCLAADRRGNESSAVFDVVVQDLTPPAPVNDFAARAEGKAVHLSWRRPPGDVKGTQITRTPGRGARISVVYTGPAQEYTDATVGAGGKYQYRAVSFDSAGNRSKAAVAAVSLRASALLFPPDGQRLSSPPRLRWNPVAGAGYYNVQLFRKGRKILSIWPKQPVLQLPSAWTFGGVRRHLTRGSYAWYVWPGYGPLAAARYGPLLGKSSFVIIRGPDAA
jgi:hypothetical protein